jgi:plastocyanin
MNVVTVCLLALLAPVSGLAKPTPNAHKVLIENIKFSPAEIEVNIGDTIVWKNEDLVPHTVTAEDASFNSKTIEPGKTWKRVFQKAGRITYKCLFHPSMKAQISIK